MKNLNLKRALLSSLIVYVLGILAFLSSFYVELMSDPELQANLVLSIVIIPAAILGAKFYYRRQNGTNGFTLGSIMFLSAMILDAIITVPLFVIPAGGNHLSFFTDPGFWMIAVIYIGTVVIYSKVLLVRIKKRSGYRTLSLIVLLITANYSFAQIPSDSKPIERKGLMAGFGLGGGTLTLNTNNTTRTTLSTTLPNLKVGYMLNDRFGVMALLPGATYKFNGKDRGFEAVLVAGQYWLKDRWWVLGGAGLTFDAPAFYTVKEFKDADFYTGLPAFAFATGYEVWQKGSFALDVQYRAFVGRSNLADNSYREGFSSMILVGFNWFTASK